MSVKVLKESVNLKIIIKKNRTILWVSEKSISDADADIAGEINNCHQPSYRSSTCWQIALQVVTRPGPRNSHAHVTFNTYYLQMEKWWNLW